MNPAPNLSPGLLPGIFPWAVRLACLVPLLAGGAGAVTGFGFLDTALAPAPDSHARYLSGLLFGIGLLGLWCAQQPRARGAAFAALAFIVVVGGGARLAGWALAGVPPLSQQLPLLMELGVVPALWLWQRRLG